MFIERAIADAVRGLETGEEPELSGRGALRSTEVIFAGWESARRRGRVDLPLDIEDNPLVAMVDAGWLGPAADRAASAADAPADGTGDAPSPDR